MNSRFALTVSLIVQQFAFHFEVQQFMVALNQMLSQELILRETNPKFQ
jgi:hypothetical protein